MYLTRSEFDRAAGSGYYASFMVSYRIVIHTLYCTTEAEADSFNGGNLDILIRHPRDRDEWALS